MRRSMIMDFCYFSSGVVSARSWFRSNSYFVWQKRNWPDFELLARKEDVSVEENTLHYRVVYTITADICK